MTARRALSNSDNVEWRRIVQPRTLFAIATVMACSSTLQAWRLAVLTGKYATAPMVARLAAVNFAYWYVPALAALPILALAQRLRRAEIRPAALIAIHTCGAFVYAVIHSAAMMCTHIAIQDSMHPLSWWLKQAQRDFFTQLDWMLMTYGALVGVAYALDYRRDAERRTIAAAQLETRLVEAQLQALRHQLQPHFLFNTLNTVSALMRTNVEAAENVLDQLGDLLRMTLRADGRQEVPLHVELEILEKYLQIEQARFGDRLAVSTAVPPEVMNALVPSFLFQPVVENAIRHGIAPHGHPGRVDIVVARVDDRLKIEVRDTGAGVSLDPVRPGVGLTNTRARLERLYGTAQSLVLANRPQGGCSVSITLPYRREEVAAEGEGARAKELRLESRTHVA